MRRTAVASGILSAKNGIPYLCCMQMAGFHTLIGMSALLTESYLNRRLSDI